VIAEIRRAIQNHDERLGKIFKVIGILLTKKDAEESREDRERIGFK
jgi:hypothetical protein